MTPGSSPRLVLSLFPGADLLGRGFEAEGFCVVRGPDLVWGGDVREFRPPADAFEGIIGGPPCQPFSSENRTRGDPTGIGADMLRQYVRVVMESRPFWFLAENVPSVPSLVVPGYAVQRFNLRASECGGRQRRNRCFQFGSRDGSVLVVARGGTETVTERAALAIEGSQQGRRSFPDFCELQGLPRSFDLPGLSTAAKYRAVGNGVPVYMARVVARAVRDRVLSSSVELCACGCGRSVAGRQVMADASCRKRMQRKRDGERAGVVSSVTV